MKRLFYLSSLAAILLLCTITVNVQSDLSLNESFDKIMESSESYEEYKVIKTSKLVSFKNQMLDSLTEYRSYIISLEQELSGIQEELASLKTQFQSVESELKASQEKADMIGFLWFEMNKMTYTIFFGPWSAYSVCSCSSCMEGSSIFVG